MNRTKNFSTAFSLGLLAALGSVSLAQEGAGRAGIGVELIAPPGDAGAFGNFYFSSDGELQLVHAWPGQDSVIYSYQNGQWVLIRRDILVNVIEMIPTGISNDGSVKVLTDFNRTEVIDGSAVLTVPRMWFYSVMDGGHVHNEHVFGTIAGGTVSGDGHVVTLRGLEPGRSKTDSLVWMGGSELINISDGLPREEASYGAGLPNEDGSVIVFGAGLNNSSGEFQIWVWEDGERTEIPRLDPTIEEFHEFRAITADGRAVFGTDGGPDRGALNYWAGPLVDPSDWWARPSYSAGTAWVWTQQGGIEPIIDRSRFLETIVMDINADGSVMLGKSRAIGTNDWEQFLWFGDNDFVIVDDLLTRLGISIEAQWYGFYQISDDGTKLMGSAFIDGQSSALIVTIPARKP